MSIKIERIHPAAKLPTVAHPGEDLCFDLSSVEKITLYPFVPTAVRTGLRMELPEGFGAVIRPRSGMGSKGVIVLGGEIDNGYRGEIMVLLVLVNKEYGTLGIEVGDRIAQIRPQMVLSDMRMEEVEEITSASARGAAGFGSTGR